MNISISLRELLDKGLWDNFCELKGWNVWCIKEGLASSDEVIILTIDEYKQIGG
jgi:hypothetical protein